MTAKKEICCCCERETASRDIYGCRVARELDADRTDVNDHVCAACDAVIVRHAMVKTGRAVLYLRLENGGLPATVGSWIGSEEGALKIPVRMLRKSHGTRRAKRDRFRFPVQTTVYFYGPDGCRWIGVHKGDNDIVRCRRLAKGSRAWS